MMEKLKKYVKSLLSDQLKHSLLLSVSKIKLAFVRRKVGDHTFIDKTVNVYGWQHVNIGENSLIGEMTWLNVNHREPGFDHIKIGDHCYIGRRNLISSAKQVVIKDYVMTSNDCKFLGSNHLFQDPMMPYISTGTTSTDSMYIGVNVWVGASAIVLGRVTIGHGSIIGAGSVVTKDIPPFSIAAGNPCQVIKRYDPRQKKWIKIGDFDKSMEAQLPGEEEYLSLLKKNKPTIVMPVYAATSAKGDLP